MKCQQCTIISHVKRCDVFALCDLENKDINIDTELSSATTICDLVILKKLPVDNLSEYKGKNKRAYDMLLHSKFFFTTNKIPETAADDSDAYYRRNIIISFPKSLKKKRLIKIF